MDKSVNVASGESRQKDCRASQSVKSAAMM